MHLGVCLCKNVSELSKKTKKFLFQISRQSVNYKDWLSLFSIF